MKAWIIFLIGILIGMLSLVVITVLLPPSPASLSIIDGSVWNW